MPKITKNQQQKIIRWHTQGLNDLEISSRLGVDVNEVLQFRKQKGLLNQNEIANRRMRKLGIAVTSGIIGVAVLGGGYYLLSRPSKPPLVQDYQDQQIIDERQATLDNLVANDSGPHLGRVLYEHILTDSSDDGDSYGITAFDSSLYGRRNPAGIIMFRIAFEDEALKIMGKPFVVPGKVKIKVAFKHEWFHAKFQYEGINLGNGLSLDGTDFALVKRDVSRFVNESMVQLETYKFFRDEGKDEAAILFVSGKAGGWFNQEVPKMLALANVGKLSKLEYQLAGSIVERYNRLVPEFNNRWSRYASSK